MNETVIPGGVTYPANAYNPHVKSYPDYPGMKTPYIFLDYLLGMLLLFCMLVGIPGNILGLRFFYSKTRAAPDRVTLLYIFICSTDTLTSITHLPVTIAMFRGRQPGVFNHLLFCALWEVLYTILQKISIFLVLLISTSRTIAILKPLYKIRIRTVIYSVVGYLMLLVLIPVVQSAAPRLRGEFKYSWDGAYCYYNFERKFEHAINLVLVGVPPILTFINLLLSVSSLFAAESRRSRMKSPKTKTRIAEAWKYEASITIVMFTSLFLLCNIPLFINLLHNMTTTFFGVEYPGVYFSTRFMFWYSWHIAKMESVVVNAALNPLLYYSRMKSFRTWSRQVLTYRTLIKDDDESRAGFVIR